MRNISGSINQRARGYLSPATKVRTFFNVPKNNPNFLYLFAKNFIFPRNSKDFQILKNFLS